MRGRWREVKRGRQWKRCGRGMGRVGAAEEGRLTSGSVNLYLVWRTPSRLLPIRASSSAALLIATAVYLREGGGGSRDRG